MDKTQPTQHSSLRRRFPKLRRRLIVYGTLYFIAFTLAAYMHLTDQLVLFPTTRPIPTRATPTTLPYAHGELQIYVADTRACRDAEPQAIVLEFTGNATRAEQIVEETAQVWQHHPVQVWTVNYPGYGRSTGPARLQSIADAALAAYDAALAASNGKSIFLVGTSLGTTAALHVAANRDVAGLILTNPPPLRQLIRGKFGWWNLWLAATPISWGVPGDLDSLANAKCVVAPAVFVTSDRDEVVPLAYQQRVADAYAGEKRILQRENRGHNDPIEGNDSVWMGTQVDWLWSQAIRAEPATAP